MSDPIIKDPAAIARDIYDLVGALEDGLGCVRVCAWGASTIGEEGKKVEDAVELVADSMGETIFVLKQEIDALLQALAKEPPPQPEA